MAKLAVLLLSVVLGAYSFPFDKKAEPTCGYSSCHQVNPDKITVHLIPHSHDDVGWLKTVDQYYFGSRSDIQRAGVQYIIGSYTEALKQNPDRRFIQVETAFFWKWWNHQNDEVKEQYRELVNNGQIEIINGAWSMNDEAATNYQSTIDQFTWGLRFINDTLGTCGLPKIGWQIDPFGHSREMASLYYRLGYDGFFFARLDYRDKDTRKANQNMDFVWRGSANNDDNQVFGSILVDFYTSPSGMCFDIECGDRINDDPQSPDFNLQNKIDDFANQIKERIKYYRTSNILIPMGGDFEYQAAETNFINMDKLIEGFKDNKEIELIYSTPSCYLKAVNEEMAKKKIKIPLKTDDFFPYASDKESFWTGYFSSRPTSKRFERVGNNILQAAKQLATKSKLDSGIDYDKDIVLLREAMGIMQHHDAVTGTEKTHVFQDYTRVLNRAIRKAETNVGSVISNLLKKSGDTELNLVTCLLANVTICETAEWDKFVVAVYNPLSQAVTYPVRLPAQDKSYKVTGPEGASVPSEVLDSISKFSHINEVTAATGNDLLFIASDVPPVGLKLYYVEAVSSLKQNKKSPNKVNKLQYGTDKTSFELDASTNLLKSVTMNGQTVKISQNFYYYESTVPNDGRSSGAYVFRPRNSKSFVVSDKVTLVNTVSNDLVDEVHLKFNDWAEEIIRVYKQDDTYIEFDWLVGPIPVDEKSRTGKEMVNRFILPSDMDTKDEFYTDSNGREMLKRVINKRSDYEYNSNEEPVTSNYYPITSKISVKDEAKKIQVAVLNDRSQGGAHLNLDDQRYIELMIHRRCLVDDGFGVSEALNETEYDQPLRVRGQHYLVIGSTESNDDGLTTSAQERDLAQKKLVQPWVLVGKVDGPLEDKLNYVHEGLVEELPKNVHLLTLEAWKDDSIIIRLEHVLENGEDPTLSKPATVDLAKLLKNFTPTSVRETTLGANQWMEDFNKKEKFSWDIEQSTVSTKQENKGVQDEGTKVTLQPMEIRTFIVS